jgi:hypothetical protein
MKSMAPVFPEDEPRGEILSSKLGWSNHRRGPVPNGSRAVVRLYQMSSVWLRFVVPIVIVAGVFYYLMIGKTGQTGSVIVRSNIQGAEVLVDGSPMGCTTDTVVVNIPVGKVTVSVRKDGYRSTPPFEVINIRHGHSPEVHFDLEEEYLADFYEGVKVREKNASIPAQMYEYMPKPARRGMTPMPTTSKPTRKEIPRSSKQILGSIIVSTNVKDAEILLNGQPTGRKTNATLEEIPQGDYTVSVAKEGFLVDPPSIDVNIERDLQSELVVFSLRAEKEMPTPHLEISTEPMAGQIYLNGQPVGSGEYKKDMEFGKYLIAFGSIPGYFDPAPQEIVLSEDNPSADVVGTYVKAKGKALLAVVRPEDNGIIEGGKLKVAVDDNPYFISPGGEHNGVLLENLVQGKHRVRVDYDGKSEEIDVTLQDDGIAMVSLQMERFLNFRNLRLRFEGMKNKRDWEKYSKELNVLAVQ